MSWITDVAPSVSAVAALGATIAAWRSVALANRQQRQREEPYLAFDLVDRGLIASMSVENFGGGIGRKASFIVLSEGVHFAGWLSEDGRIRPGEIVDIELDLLPARLEEAQAMVLCVDRWHAVHVWSREGDHRTYDQARWARAGRIDWWAFRQFYPGAERLSKGSFIVSRRNDSAK